MSARSMSLYWTFDDDDVPVSAARAGEAGRQKEGAPKAAAAIKTEALRMTCSLSCSALQTAFAGHRKTLGLMRPVHRRLRRAFPCRAHEAKTGPKGRRIGKCGGRTVLERGKLT